MNSAVPPLPSELHLSEEQLRAIGCATVEWERVDVLIDGLIWLISENPNGAGRVLTDRLETGAKLQLLRALAVARIAHEKDRETFEHLCDEIANVLSRRNLLISFRGHRSSVNGPVASAGSVIGAREARTQRPDRTMAVARRLFRLQGELRRFFHLHTKEFLAAKGKTA